MNNILHDSYAEYYLNCLHDVHYENCSQIKPKNYSLCFLLPNQPNFYAINPYVFLQFFEKSNHQNSYLLSSICTSMFDNMAAAMFATHVPPIVLLLHVN